MQALVATDPASCRYLTQIDDPDGVVVLPIHAEPTAFTREAAPSLEWLSDVRPVVHGWAPPLVERLRELHAELAIVGVTGLDPLISAPEGRLNYNSFVIMREWLNHTRWVGASALVREATAIKSTEEVAALRQSAAAAEAGLLAALGASGSLDTMRAAAMAEIARLGAEPEVRIGQREGITELSLSAASAGYRAPLVQPAAPPGPDPARSDAWSWLVESWSGLWQRLRPGANLLGLAAAPTQRGACWLSARIRGAGLGDDLPAVSAGRVDAVALDGPVLRAGECFLLEIDVRWNGAKGEQRLTWGDTVALNPSGPERLGRRVQELPSLP